MREIELRNRSRELVAVALVDDEDYERINARRWCRNRAGYATRFNGIYLHREVLGLIPGDGNVVDHINRDKLDNRRANLRLVSHMENGQNLNPTGATSTYRGVHWDKVNEKWRAAGATGGKLFQLGRFVSEEEAAAVALAWRLKHHAGAVD